MTTEERLEKLERELAAVKRRARRLLIVFALTAGGVALAWMFANPTGTAFGKVIRANAFVLEDDQGRTRGMLAVTKEGPALGLSDENGKTRAMLSVFKDEPGLTLGDEKGTPRTMLGAGTTEGLVLGDENGKPRVALGAGTDKTKDGRKITYPESSVRLYGPDGYVIWSAPR